MSAESEREELARAFSEHRPKPRVGCDWDTLCTCGFRFWKDEQYDDHLATVALNTRQSRAEIRAEALEAAADDYVNIVGGTKARPVARTWLRDRAQRIREGGDHD